MTFVNGELQAQFMARIRGLDPQRCLVVPVDVGKAIAMALVADHYGEIIVAPFEFPLTETGFQALSAAVTRAERERDALIVSAPPTADLGLTISSSEPSWIALRREGVVEFEGLLNGERRIDNLDLVEIYAGRPDLVQLSSPDAETRTLGAVDDIRWIPLSPAP